MKSIVRLFSIVTTGFLLAACEKEIEFPVKEKDKLLVIQAELGTATGSLHVKLSQSIGLYQNSFPAVSNATVTITDENSLNHALAEQSAGYYVLNSFYGQEGKSYRLTVQYDGKIYTATSVIPAAASIDTAELFFVDSGLTNISVTIRDTVPGNSYYGLRAYLRDTLVSYFTVISEEELAVGKYQSNISFKEIVFKSGDTVEVELLTLNKQTYDYFIQLNYLSLTEFSGFFQVSAPDNPKTNFNNKAVGYFSSHAVHRKPIIIP